MPEQYKQVERGALNTPEEAGADSDRSEARQFRRRMLAWPNPVEYVNNMYGCHPGEDGTEYFSTVFGK